MRPALRLYIASVVAAALAAVVALHALGPSSTTRGTATAAFLCAIGWLASRMTYELDQKGTHASVGFLLFHSAAFAVADWTVPLAVGVTVLGLDIRRKA